MGPFEIIFVYFPLGVLALAFIMFMVQTSQFESRYFRIEEDVDVVDDVPRKKYVVKGKWPRQNIVYHTTGSLIGAQNWCSTADREMDKVKP